METLQQLIDLGFEQKEAKIYLAVLEFGPVSISGIAKKAGIKRPTVYHHIDDLVKKDFIQQTVSGKRTLYMAQNPQKIISSLDEKRKSIEQMLPQLQSLYQSSAKQPKIRYYEGKEGLKRIYEEIFNTSGAVYGIFSPAAYFKIFTLEENAQLFNLLKEKGGRIYDLVERGEGSEKLVKQEYRKNSGRVKFLPEDFKITTDILVTGSKVAMISLTNLTGVLIDNKEIADTQRALLKAMW
jgi:sugar-specific transcriptional regulator TrmB